MNWQAREAERWLTQAFRDLEAAEKLLHQKEYNWVCFIAQQAAEKAVKPGASTKYTSPPVIPMGYLLVSLPISTAERMVKSAYHARKRSSRPSAAS